MPASENRRPFIMATYAMVSAPAFAQGVGWTDDGKGLEIRDVSYFCDSVLPHFFRHCNLASFSRQLNMYGFEKAAVKATARATHVFINPAFVRGGENNIGQIKRKSAGKTIEEIGPEEAMCAVGNFQALATDQCSINRRIRALEQHNTDLSEQAKQVRAAVEQLHVVQLDMRDCLDRMLRAMRGNDAPTGKKRAALCDEGATKRAKANGSAASAHHQTVNDAPCKPESAGSNVLYLPPDPGDEELVCTTGGGGGGGDDDVLGRSNSSCASVKSDSLLLQFTQLEDIVAPSKEALALDDECQALAEALAVHVARTSEVAQSISALCLACDDANEQKKQV